MTPPPTRCAGTSYIQTLANLTVSRSQQWCPYNWAHPSGFRHPPFHALVCCECRACCAGGCLVRGCTAADGRAAPAARAMAEVLLSPLACAMPCHVADPARHGPPGPACVPPPPTPHHPPPPTTPTHPPTHMGHAYGACMGWSPTHHPPTPPHPPTTHTLAGGVGLRRRPARAGGEERSSCQAVPRRVPGVPHPLWLQRV